MFDNNESKKSELFRYSSKEQKKNLQINRQKLNEIKINRCGSLNNDKNIKEDLIFQITSSNIPNKKTVRYISTDIGLRTSFYIKDTNNKTKFSDSVKESPVKNTISTKNKTAVYYKDSPLFQMKTKIIDEDEKSYKILKNNFEVNKNKKICKTESKLYYFPNQTKNEEIDNGSLLKNIKGSKKKYKLFKKNMMENLDKIETNNIYKEKNAKNGKNEKKIYISKIIKNIETKDDRIHIRINYILYFPNKKKKNKYNLLETQSGSSFTYLSQKRKTNWAQNKIYYKKFLCTINEADEKSQKNSMNHYTKRNYNNNIFKLIKIIYIFYINMFKKRFFKILNMINFIVKCYIFEKLIKIYYFKKTCSILKHAIIIKSNYNNYVNENVDKNYNKNNSNVKSGDSSDLILSLNKDTIIDDKFLTSISELNNNINHDNDK